MRDVIIIGGGVIGLTTAYELAQRGLQVTVLDQGRPGGEASWAGAGILPPARLGDPDDALARLTIATHALWPRLAAELLERTGIDDGFQQCGGLCFSPDADAASLQTEMSDWIRAGARAERLSHEELAGCEPAVGRNAGPAFRLPDTWQVRNPRHLQALLAGCAQLGVEIRAGQGVEHIERQGDQVLEVRTATQRWAADAFLVAAGAWSQRLLEEIGCRRRIEPVRGQIVLLSTPAPLLRHVLECGRRYIVPRPDGRTLVGSTEEWVGFDKRSTPTAVRGLMDFALRMVPTLAEAQFERAWSGLRPQSVDGRPLLGRLPHADNLYVAAGHFRAGLHLSPITGRLMSQLMTGETPDISLESFAPSPAVD